MSQTDNILAVIKDHPGATAGIIAQRTGVTVSTCKATLWRLYEADRIGRKKVKVTAPKGPQSVYAYFLGEEDGIQKETGKEVNAQQVTSTSQADGSGSARSQVRKEGGYPPLYR